MTGTRDPDRLIHAFVLEGEEELHDQVYDAVRAHIERTPQRAGGGPWRMPIMNRMLGFGLAAGAVVVAILIGAQVLGSPSTNLGGPADDPTPATSSASSPEPTVQPTGTPDAGLPEGSHTVAASYDGAPGISVTIPASGWTDGEIALFKGEEVDNLPEAAVLLWSWPAGEEFYVALDPCASESTRPDEPLTTPEEIVAALAAQSSRVVSEPRDVQIGGYPGASVTLRVPEDVAADECELNEYVSLATDEDPLARYHQGPSQIDEFWFLDVDGVIVMIDAVYRPDTPDALIDEMRTIAESATFKLP